MVLHCYRSWWNYITNIQDVRDVGDGQRSTIISEEGEEEKQNKHIELWGKMGEWGVSLHKSFFMSLIVIAH